MTGKCPKCGAGLVNEPIIGYSIFYNCGRRCRGIGCDTEQCLHNQLAQKEELLFAYDQTRTPPNPIHIKLLKENKRLREIVDKLPKKEAVEQAIRIIGSSVQTHEHWLAYRKRGGASEPLCGDQKHQEECLNDYAQVTRVLNSTREAAEAAKEGAK